MAPASMGGYRGDLSGKNLRAFLSKRVRGTIG